MRKICSKCKIEKEINEFHNRKSTKDGKRSDCKECFKQISKIWQDNNKEKCLSYHRKSTKKYRENNPEIVKEGQKIWYENNKEYFKEWRLDNLNSVKEAQIKYKLSDKGKETIKLRTEENREKRKIWYNQYRTEKKKNNPLFALTERIRKVIYNSFYNNGYSKKSKSQEILGCTFEEFKIYLESKFELWMNWENRGLYNGELNYGWDIDHIIPLANALSEYDLLKLNHYSNLQPLCSKINRDIKRDLSIYQEIANVNNIQ